MAQVKQQELAQKAEQAEKQEKAVRLMCSGPNGEAGLKVLRELFFDIKSYTRSDPYHTAFKEGQRDVVGFMIECAEEAADEVS